MVNLKNDLKAAICATNCKTSERIAKDKYCCLEFRDSFRFGGLFYLNPGSNKYFICGPTDQVRVRIDYCPWCTKPVPWKEIDDRES